MLEQTDYSAASSRTFEQHVGQALLARLHALDRRLDGVLGDQPVHEDRLVLTYPVRPVHALVLHRQVSPGIADDHRVDGRELEAQT